MRSLVPVLALLIALPPAAARAAQEGAPAAGEPAALPAAPAGGGGSEVEPFVVRMARPLDWGAVGEREARISFPAASARVAARDLASSALDSVRRAAALAALGASRLPGARETLEAWAGAPLQLERRAALLGLGMLGVEGLPALRVALESPDAALRETALTAMATMESAAVRDEVRALAEDPDHPAAETAAVVARYLDNPLRRGASEPESLRLFYELRYEAALRYGLVDGRSWAQARLEELSRDAAFLGELVLRCAPELEMQGVADHLVALVQAEGGPLAVRAAVHAAPGALARLASTGAWTPRDAAEWEAVLAGLADARHPRAGYELARLAYEVEGLQHAAVRAMVSMGDDTAPARIPNALFDSELADRIQLARALGSSRHPSWIAELSKVRTDPAPELRMACLVAQMRMGFRPAEDVVRTMVLAGDSKELGALVRELCDVQRDFGVGALLEAALPRLTGSLQLRASAVLASGGKVLARRAVLEALAGGVESPVAVEIVRALGTRPTLDELEALGRMFPTGDRAVDLELGRVLARGGHAAGVALLRRGLWTPPFDQSLLAAALIRDVRGIPGLLAELEKPPQKVSRGDLRRVGFALGEWGGTGAVEDLARRRPASDPALQGAYLGAMSARTQ